MKFERVSFEQKLHHFATSLTVLKPLCCIFQQIRRQNITLSLKDRKSCLGTMPFGIHPNGTCA